MNGHITDTQAMDIIAGYMASRAWDRHTLEVIDEVMLATGRDIKEPAKGSGE